MRATYKCPHCNQETDYLNKESNLGGSTPKLSKHWVVHRVYDDKNKTIIWKNLFRMRIVDLLFLISVILLLIGFWQINEQCHSYMEDPCSYAEQTNQCQVFKINKTINDASNPTNSNYIPIGSLS